jgi:hypothetical protein
MNWQILLGIILVALCGIQVGMGLERWRRSKLRAMRLLPGWFTSRMMEDNWHSVFSFRLDGLLALNISVTFGRVWPDWL